MRIVVPALVSILVTLPHPARASDTAAPATTTATAAPATPTAGPRIRFDSKDQSFGKIVAGGAVDRVFAFENVGAQELEITRIAPACICTAALLGKKRFLPRERGEIKVHFESGERIGFQNIDVQVFSSDGAENDGGAHVSVLHLRGEVANLLSVMPPSFYFPSLLRGTPALKTVTVLPIEGASVGALEVSASKPWLKTSVKPFERDGKKGFAVSVDVAPDAPFGRIEGRILVKTDHPRQSLLRIPVMGSITGKIVEFPERVQILGQAGEKDPVILLLRVAGDPGIPIESVETPPGLEAEVTEVVPGKRVEIGLKVKHDAPRGPFAGTVRIFVRDAEQPLFEVPVIGEIPPRVRFEPAAVWLAPPGPTEVTLRAIGGRATRCAVEGRASALLVKLEKGDRLVVSLDPKAAPGPVNAVLRVLTEAGGIEEEVRIPVHGVVEAPKGPKSP